MWKRRQRPQVDIEAELRTLLTQKYPDLFVARRNDELLVRGRFPISDEHGVIDRFAIEMSVPPSYPDELPTLREVGGRIPRTIERHCNPDGTACLGVPEEWLVVRPDQSFEAFFAGPVHGYFVGQALVERGLTWPHGERAHGAAGAFEAFGEITGFSKPNHIRRALVLLTSKFVGGHKPCPCESGKILRNCHLAQLRAAQKKIAPRMAHRMLERLGPMSI